jgi:hypothetical protein
MPTPTQCTFDITPPRRPGITDVGGGAKVNDGEISDPAGMPTAEDDNQHQNLIVRYGTVVPVCIITVHYAAGVPSINKVAAVSTAVVSGIFTVVDNGVGDCSITWPANTFPAAMADAVARIASATIGMISCENISNGVRVRIKDSAAAAADLNFVVDVY